MNKLVRACTLAVFLLMPAAALAQEHPTPAKPTQSTEAQREGKVDAPPQAYEKTEAEHAGEEHGMLSALFWPTMNFIVLAGTLWWFLKQPIATYLTDRHESIRKDLVEAANIKTAATAQLTEIDAKLAALPGELETLKHRGAEEIAAEEKRIAALAAAERDRLLEQTRREIELQVRLAKRDLLEHAADLSVQLANERIQRSITPADQDRLVDRYLQTLAHPPASDAGGTREGRKS